MMHLDRPAPPWSPSTCNRVTSTRRGRGPLAAALRPRESTRAAAALFAALARARPGPIATWSRVPRRRRDRRQPFWKARIQPEQGAQGILTSHLAARPGTEIIPVCTTSGTSSCEQERYKLLRSDGTLEFVLRLRLASDTVDSRRHQHPLRAVLCSPPSGDEPATFFPCGGTRADDSALVFPIPD